MACQLCLAAAAVVIFLIFCWLTHEKKEIPTEPPTEQGPEDPPMIAIDRDHYEEIRPPIVGPTQKEYELGPATRYDERKYLELPRGGLSCANKHWYDSIYNGGSETVLDMSDSGAADVAAILTSEVESRRRDTRKVMAVPEQRHTMNV